MSIYTSNGVSLHQLSLELSKIRRSSTEEHDDLCSICEDGGDLLCCANCPRGFHTECVGLSAIPQGIWYCKYCQNMFEKEKFAEPDANAIAAGRVPGVDPLEAITQRCIRVVATLEPEIGGCALCSPPKVDWGWRAEAPGSLSDVVKMKSEGQDLHKNPELGIRWRLLHGKKATEDSGVALVLSTFFMRSFKDQDFCGMYCAVIDGRLGGRISCNLSNFWRGSCRAALVATRSECQGKGYFQSLFYCVEGLLASLNVKDLVLPAADEAESLWEKQIWVSNTRPGTGCSMLTFYFTCILPLQLVFNGFH
ncbi:UNVERIFIED_CONTAM: Increased DNA methylation 1 [Sesamum radiatum]|uniref:Increased DNA methylation 1 n=1 Tax=Sesamum radiatum TaxID=300843 RepID=A0AAW2JFW3_SESRA